MTASIHTGTGNFSYSNSTGGNVRIIVMSCRTESNTTQSGTVTVGSATYPIYPNTTWGKGLVAPTGDAAMMPVEYVLANGGSFSLAGATTGNPTGQDLITNTQYTDLSGNWTVPSNVTSVCVVCVGAGGYQGYGGDLSWKNHIPVTPGTTVPYQIGKRGNSSPDSAKVGGDTWFMTDETCFAGGGGYSTTYRAPRHGDGGGTGNKGAGGYTGDGGSGPQTTNNPGTAGQGGGGGGHAVSSSYGGGGGGGVGLNGKGASGAGGTVGSLSDSHGQGGSGGGNGPSGNYGGGGAGDGSDRYGGDAGMRIIWGDGRAFPAYNTQDDQTGTDTVILSYNVAIIPE
tara:strand:- start:246 stop:1265 length:1020 start_codon:yes stop_codon:yes gene_type:complete